MRFIRFCALALTVFALGGCTRLMPGAWSQGLWGTLAVGPDLESKGPFGRHHVRLTAEGGALPMRIDIRPKAPNETTDEAALAHLLSDTRTYLAGVTWHAVTPAVAETDAGRMDYWLVGLNLSRTPDRSIYTLLRFPHGADLGTAAGGHVESALLSCRDLARRQNSGDCAFDSLKDVYAATARLLKHEKGAPPLNWQKLKLTLDQAS